ncbi:CPBP family intramembrane metalloprotease [Sphingomonas sp. HDW15A]|uniref:CPBP family glutamic-type intramembrane protease n=1 Tax=Sphingomonas sp. HDW15A TaxID=2714942 RepID=UPI0014089589|nr:CPBP family glutamic-type intramembrane protease [Sphingomonas sp. HDW15A]QIK96013.1 CPBP family intramembrane metalloprotease [Sphingomonas sp. HDW15A]
MKPALPAFLFEPRQPARTILLAWPLVTLPALGLAAFFSRLIPGAPSPVFDGDPVLVFFLIEVFAPIVESLIMAAMLELLLLVVPWQWAVALSAAGWGMAHSLQAPTWGLVIWWPFLIFSILYVTWRKRSKVGAVGIAAAVHALNNLIPALLLLRLA